MISISNINGIIVKINKHKLMSIVLVLIMLFPFVPTAFHIYVPIYKNISMAAKIIVFLWVLAMLLLNIKIKLDKYFILSEIYYNNTLTAFICGLISVCGVIRLILRPIIV